MRRCPGCNAQLDQPATTCPQCGTTLGDPESARRPATSNPPTHQPASPQGQPSPTSTSHAPDSNPSRRRVLIYGGAALLGGLGLYTVLGSDDTGAAALAAEQGFEGDSPSSVEIDHVHEPTADDVQLEVIDYAVRTDGLVARFENVGNEPLDFSRVAPRLYSDHDPEGGPLTVLRWGWTDMTQNPAESQIPTPPDGDITHLEDGTVPAEPGQSGGFAVEFDPSIEEIEADTQLPGPWVFELWFERNFYRVEFHFEF